MAASTQIRLMQCGSASIYDDSGHPNRMLLTGVLVRLDEPSTKAPDGAHGHRIWMTTEVAKKRLSTLIGMGVNYSTQLNGHAQRHKVGVITKAWIEGKDLCVSGTIWKHDFPEATRDLKQAGLGMSMELVDVDVEDEGADVWKLKDFCFSGATILWKNAAAYYRTLAIAARADGRRIAMKTKAKGTVKDPIDIKEYISLAAAAGARAATKALAPKLDGLTTAVAELCTRQDSMELAAAGVVAVEDVDDDAAELAAAGKDTDDDEEACDMKAKKSADDEGDDEGDDDEEDMDAAQSAGGIDEGDLSDMGPGDDGVKPGQFGKDAKNKGRKTTSENTVGKTVSSTRLSAALQANKKLANQVATLTANQAKLTKKMAAQTKQITAATADMNRKSVVPLDNQLTTLLAKHGVSGSEMQASGQRFTVSEVDVMLAGVPGLSITDRMTLKNKMLQSNMMDQGAIYRGVI